MLNTVLIDAGPIIALFDKDDKYHKEVINFIKDIRYKFVTTAVLRVVIRRIYMSFLFIKSAPVLFLQKRLKKYMIIHIERFAEFFCHCCAYSSLAALHSRESLFLCANKFRKLCLSELSVFTGCF